MEYGEFRNKLSIILGRKHQFDFTQEEDARFKALFEEVDEDGYNCGYHDGFQDGKEDTDEDY